VFNIGPTELIVVLMIALIVFGPKRLPEIGRTVGKSLREFRRASQDLRDELHLGLDDDEPAVSTPVARPSQAQEGSASPPSPAVPPSSPGADPGEPGSTEAAS
jgi:TatA/E family protein of Tat protein translocase